MLRFVGIALLSLLGSHGSGTGVSCTLQKMTDAQRSGVVAFTYLVPDGWTTQHTINWTGDSLIAGFTATTADKTYSVGHIEPMLINFASSSGTQTKGLHLRHATDFLHSLVGSLEQQGLVSNVRVVTEFNETLPLTEGQNMMAKMRQIGGMSLSQFHETGFLKISFEHAGAPETASFGTTVVGNNARNDMGLGFGANRRTFSSENGNYVVGPTLYVASPPNPAARKVKEAQIVAGSFRETPAFSMFCAKLALAVANAGLKATQEQGREQIRQMQASREKSMQDFRKRMADRDASTHDYCNYLLDQQDYREPGGGLVTLPSNYNHAWTSGDGHYVLTDDHGFNPNGVFKGNWGELRKSERGN